MKPEEKKLKYKVVFTAEVEAEDSDEALDLARADVQMRRSDDIVEQLN